MERWTCRCAEVNVDYAINKVPIWEYDAFVIEGTETYCADSERNGPKPMRARIGESAERWRGWRQAGTSREREGCCGSLVPYFCVGYDSDCDNRQGGHAWKSRRGTCGGEGECRSGFG